MLSTNGPLLDETMYSLFIHQSIKSVKNKFVCRIIRMRIMGRSLVETVHVQSFSVSNVKQLVFKSTLKVLRSSSALI